MKPRNSPDCSQCPVIKEIESRTSAVDNAHLKFERYGCVALSQNEEADAILNRTSPVNLANQAATLYGTMVALTESRGLVEAGFDQIDVIAKQINGLQNLARISCSGVISTPKWHGLGENSVRCTSVDAPMIMKYFKMYPRMRLK